MSLDWNATKAPNWDKLDSNHKESLIFSCMSVGIGEITEANVEEWYQRYLQTYRAYGWGETYLSLEDVRNGIGLTTNVFPKETRAAFGKKIARIVDQKATEELREIKRKLEEAATNG